MMSHLIKLGDSVLEYMKGTEAGQYPVSSGGAASTGEASDRSSARQHWLRMVTPLMPRPRVRKSSHCQAHSKRVAEPGKHNKGTRITSGIISYLRAFPVNIPARAKQPPCSGLKRSHEVTSFGFGNEFLSHTRRTSSLLCLCPLVLEASVTPRVGHTLRDRTHQAGLG